MANDISIYRISTLGLHSVDLHVSMCKRQKGQNSGVRVHIKGLRFWPSASSYSRRTFSLIRRSKVTTIMKSPVEAGISSAFNKSLEPCSKSRRVKGIRVKCFWSQFFPRIAHSFNAMDRQFRGNEGTRPQGGKAHEYMCSNIVPQLCPFSYWKDIYSI